MLDRVRRKSWDLDVLTLETSRGLVRARSRALLKVDNNDSVMLC